MRVAFAGTAPFAELVLRGLAFSEHRLTCVITNPDRPRGRHGTPQAPAIKDAAETLGLPVLQPQRLSEPDALAELLATGAEILVVCAYGQIIGRSVLDAVTTVVVHPSAVPRWRGAAPVERALMAGETEIGVATLLMTEGIDEGPVGDLRFVNVPADADAGCVYELLAPAAVAGVLETLRRVATGTVEWRPQAGTASYAAKIGPQDKVIDWERPAMAIAAQVRALSPHIGAVTDLAGRRTRVWRAEAGSGPLPAASRERLVLPAGRGWVEVLELQYDGGRRMSAAEFLRGAGRTLARP